MNKIQQNSKLANSIRLLAIGFVVGIAFIQSAFAQSSTTTTLTSSLNPVSEGQAFTLTATVTGSTPTGTVTINSSGNFVLATVTLTNGTASFTTSGGAGTYSLTAVYSGDGANLASTSSIVSQVVSNYAGAGIYFPAALEDGQNYPLSNGTTNGSDGRPAWTVSSSTTTAVSIITNDLSGATSPDIKPIPNPTNSASSSHLRLNLSGAAARYYYRPIAIPVTTGSVYFSMLLNVTSNSIVNQYICGLNSSTVTSGPTNTDPVTLLERQGSDANHYQLGIQSLNGTTVWATNDLLGNETNVNVNTYLIVLKYDFGGTCALYINPTPGQSEPTPSATANSGATPPPINIDTIVFGESGATRGTNHYDVMRVDTTWGAVTPSILESPSTATKLVISPASQSINSGQNSALMTLTLEDQGGNPLTNSTSAAVVNLSSTSAGGVFFAADGVTVITNLTLAAGSSTGTFYYYDSIAGSPTITAASGLLTPAAQSETILPGCTPPTVYSVTGGGAYCSTAASPSVGLANSQSGDSYQLYSNSMVVGAPVGGTGSALNFGPQLPGTYSVVGFITASPGCSAAMGGVVMVAINYAAEVTANPTNQSILAGYTASFAVSAGQTTSPTYQWQVSTNNGSSWANVTSGTGGTNASYTTAAATVANNGNKFQCMINGSGACGATAATSTVATLTVSQATTTNILASSVNPANAGQSITFTATVISPGAQPTGTVIFESGGAILGTGTLSSGIASYTTSGGVGTNLISAIYSGDANNTGSASGTISQVIQPGGTIANPAALLEDGQDYAPQTAPTGGIGPWGINSSSTVIGILLGDLSGATSPDIKPLPNNTTNFAAHLEVGGSTAASREYVRGLSNSVSGGSVYFSMLMAAGFNPSHTDEVNMTLLAAGLSNAPSGLVDTDPLSIHTRNVDSTHFNLGIERLGGTTVWASNNLMVSNTYLLVMKYTFGPAGTCDLYINATPGGPEPSPSASATAGATSEPANIGSVLFFEGPTPFQTSGSASLGFNTGFNYDVMRADTNWADVTPSSSSSGLGLTSVAFTSAPQIFLVNTNSPLMTISLEDQSNNVFSATSPAVVSLGSSSPGGVFVSAADGTTVITNVAVATGSNSASFYYYDNVAGNPTLTASSGLLTPGTQSEIVNPPPSSLDHFTVTSSVSSATVGTVFTVTVQAYDSNNTAIMNSSLDGSIVTMTSSGLAAFDANQDGSYGDNTRALTNGALTVNAEDLKAESVTFTATLGLKTGASSAVAITSGAATQLQLLLPGETAAPGTTLGKTGAPAVQHAGVGFNLVVNLVDTNWNVVSNSDMIHVTGVGDPSVVLPADTALSAGSATLGVTNIVAGSGYSLAVTDSSDGGITGATSSVYSVAPGAVARLVLLAPGETATPGIAPGKTGTPVHQTEGVPFTLTVDAFDSVYNLVTPSSDTVGITSSDSRVVLPANAALAGGAAMFPIAQYTGGPVTDTASDVTSPGALTGTTTITVDPVPQYRSVANGSWEDTNIWQISFDGAAWSPASNTPTALNADVISVTNGFTVTVNANETIDQTVVSSNSTLAIATGATVTVVKGGGADLEVLGTVNNAGTLTNGNGATINFESAASYLHNQDGGSIVTATWDTNSTCAIVGWKTNTVVSAATGLKQKFGNFTWNSLNQTVQLSCGPSAPTNFSGNFNVISTGSGALAICVGATINLNIGGNVNVLGGALYAATATTSGDIETVNIAGDVNVNGGTLDLETAPTGTEVVTWNLAGDLNISHGILTSGSTNAHPTIKFVKVGKQKLTVGASGSIAATNTINWDIAGVSTLDLGTNVLSGSGFFTLESGGGVITAHAHGLAGSLAMVSSNVTLSTAGNYTYDGVVAQSGDTLLPATVSSLTVSNTLGLTLYQTETATWLTLSGGLTGSNIALDFGGAFTVFGPSIISGNVSMNSDALTLVAASNNLPVLTVANSTLNFLNNPVTLTVLGSPLPQGNYLLIDAVAGGGVGGIFTNLATVDGSGLTPGLAGLLQVSGSRLYLSAPALYAFVDSARGFFSGVNMWFTNASGLAMFAWSSTDPNLSISNWSAEGLMQEQPLNDGTGQSRYSINVTPSASPTYYIAGTTNIGAYLLSPVPVTTITTPDFTNFSLAFSNTSISPAGVLALSSASPPSISSGGVYNSGGFQLQFSGTSGHNYVVQASTNLATWTNISTGTFGASAASFTDPAATNYSRRFYRISSQ